MSRRNGDRSRFDRQRRAKIHKRARIRELQQTLVLGLPLLSRRPNRACRDVIDRMPEPMGLPPFSNDRKRRDHLPRLLGLRRSSRDGTVRVVDSAPGEVVWPIQGI